MAYLEATKLKDKDGNIISPSSEDTVSLLKRIFYLLKPLSIITGAGSNRLSVDVATASAVTTVTTVTTVSTVSTVTNQANMGGVYAFDLMKSASRTAYNTGVRAKLT